VYEASNGQEAIAIFEKESPQLVFLDVIMPEVSGMDVLKLIGGKTNVFVVSAIGQIALIEEAQKLGAKGYIVKPFEKSDILKKIQQYIPQS
jgi:two-component system chemotaxis response regulator CheY